MKMVLCTLAVCLSVLASVFTTRALVRDEGKRIRNSFTKTFPDPGSAQNRQEAFLQKLDALNAQLATLNRRLPLLEESAGQSQRDTATAEPLRITLQTLSKRTEGVASSLAKLDAMPGFFSELTTYLDQSFEHLEETVTVTAIPEALTMRIGAMEKKLTDIDNYFTPLYAFLGLVYDPEKKDLLAAYPSVDARISAISKQLEAVRADIADLREWLTPRTIDPARRIR